MVETLEELKELNKRKVIVNFDDMLHRYDEERESEAAAEAAAELEDEQLIKYVCFFITRQCVDILQTCVSRVYDRCGYLFIGLCSANGRKMARSLKGSSTMEDRPATKTNVPKNWPKLCSQSKRLIC